MFENINLKGARVTYNDFEIDEEVSLGEQRDQLKEDMLQISFPDNIILDIGWYPEFDLCGSFKIVVIKDFDWSDPIFYRQTRDLKILKKYFDLGVKFIKKQKFDIDDEGIKK